MTFRLGTEKSLTFFTVYTLEIESQFPPVHFTVIIIAQSVSANRFVSKREIIRIDRGFFVVVLFWSFPLPFSRQLRLVHALYTRYTVSVSCELVLNLALAPS